MTIVRTDLRDTIDSARRIRFEQTNGIRATNVQTAIEQVTSTPPGLVPTPVNPGNSPYTPSFTDNYLAVDTTAGPVTINLQPMSDRRNVPLTIKDVGGNASVNNITLAAQPVDGLSPYLINGDYGSVELIPGNTEYAAR